MLVINGQHSNYHIGNSYAARFSDNGVMRYPNRIKELCDKKDIKQAELARLTGYEPPQIGRWWHGQRKLNQDHLAVFARALKCKPAEIIDDVKPQENLTATDLALLFAVKALIRAMLAGKGIDKGSMLRSDFELALSHYRAANKPDAVSVMDALLLLVDDPRHQEEQLVTRKLLELSPGSRP